jgi:hypothetical protein
MLKDSVFLLIFVFYPPISTIQDCLQFCVGIGQLQVNLAYCKKKLKFIMEHYWVHKDVKDMLIKISSYLDILFCKE